jgi:hypothetical protein
MTNIDDTMNPPAEPVEEEKKPEEGMPAEGESTEAPAEEEAPQA